MAWLDLKGPVVADTVYADDALVAKDVSFTLGAISFETSDVQAMGTLTVPTIGRIENIELSITKIGLDEGLSRLNRLEKQNLELRWVQNKVESDGTISAEGCKLFVRTMPGSLPELGVEPGSDIEGEITFNVTRAVCYVNGEEQFLVDRLSAQLRVDGKDYMNEINNLL